MDKQIFVFGSNEAGVHGAGAAKTALQQYGAIYGKGNGLQGDSYGIPTKDRRIKTLPLNIIGVYVQVFIECAANNPEYTFNVTRVGCGLAGYTDQQIAPLFINVSDNVNLPFEWEWFMPTDKQYSYIHWNIN